MSKLTGTHSEVSAIDFTTLTTVPGTLKVHGAPIQILDLRAHAQQVASFSFLLAAMQLVSLRAPPMVVVEVTKTTTAMTQCKHSVGAY